ncbi:hypothetical protein FKZ61_003895 [Litorilinea aerophila]|uniref:Uncharacterized protein n=1 Tax=Litorilinea aerophila TaxID=1204385 RepID=A0A540VKA0_9CHLR|nr:hypothetical protein [Litorilinea aerophila]MCC9075256.1 hypothetical protein [Litorilinea aerophila]
MENFFTSLGLWTGDLSLLAAGLAAALIVLVWDWRASLVGLVAVELGVALAAIRHLSLPLPWATIQGLVIVLACLILALSIRQVAAHASLYQAGTWMLRVGALLLAFWAWLSLRQWLSLPMLEGGLMDLFIWLGLCVLVLLGLSDNPFYTGVGLLLWCIPAQVIVSALLAVPALIAIIGILELLLALACSYLILAERLPEESEKLVLTDIVFPEPTARREMPTRGSARRLPRWRRLLGQWGLAGRARVGQEEDSLLMRRRP